jgi:N-dimethylarginine dimethylaminohydrolase
VTNVTKSVLFCPPTYFQVRDAKNPFMQPGTPVDLDLAKRQWEDLRRAFSLAGFQLACIDAVEDLEDMVFAANQVFVGVNRQGKSFIVPSRMRYQSRQREVPHYVRWFRDRGYQVIDLDLADDDFLEGHGDLLWQPGRSLVWAGYGFRSTRAGVEKFAERMREMEIEVVPLELVDPTFYHLDTCLAPLTAEAVLIYPGAFASAALHTIRNNISRLYEVNREEALRFVCNGVTANGYFITPQVTPDLERALAEEKLQPLVVNTSEFEKSGGSICCLKLFIP